MINEYEKYLKEADKPVISSTCPVVVNFIQKYYPELVKNLAPIVSPMGALVQYLKHSIKSDRKVVLIGPCHAKKMEFIDYEIVEGVLTYTEVFNMFEKNFDIYKSKDNNNKNKEVDSIINNDSRNIPISGGLKEALQDKTDDRFLKVEGEKKLKALFDMMSDREIKPKFVDALFCDGCINGVDLTDKSHFKKEIAVNQFIDNEKRVETKKYNKIIDNDLNCNVKFEKDYQKLEEPSEKEIWEILAKTNKYTKEDLLNCGAC